MAINGTASLHTEPVGALVAKVEELADRLDRLERRVSNETLRARGYHLEVRLDGLHIVNSKTGQATKLAE